MAVSAIQANNKLIKFREEIIREFVRQNMFSPYMGNSMTSVIRVMNDLKSGGEQVNVPLVNSLRATAIATGTLTGAEEAIDNYGFRMWIDWARNAVRTTKAESQKDSADIFDIARPLLTDWGQELIKNEIVDAFLSLPLLSAPANLGTANGQRVNGISWDNAAAGDRNSWNAANVDRVLYGAAVSNYNATWATAAATVDNTTDKLTAASLKLMKRLAMKASPRIRPLRTNDGYDYYVLFCDPNQFRDLSNDQTVVNANLYARPRERAPESGGNPLFMDGDLLYDGVIVRQVPEMRTRRPTVFATAGTGGTIAINAACLCGQSAMAMFYGQLPRPTQLDQTDYQFNRGVGIEMAYGLSKVAKCPVGSAVIGSFKDWGVFTGFFASVDDT
jgi:N4-gp56 family major capsid protein